MGSVNNLGAIRHVGINHIDEGGGAGWRQQRIASTMRSGDALVALSRVKLEATGSHRVLAVSMVWGTDICINDFGCETA